MSALHRRCRAGRDDRRDGGTAVIEFVFVAVVVMVPLIYLVVAVAAVQRSNLAVSQAAREAGRAFATSDTAAEAGARAEAAVGLALRDQGLDVDADVRFVRAGDGCDADAVTPVLAPGASFTVCVSRTVQLPAVPRLLTGRGITTVGAYTVHVDDYRVVR